MLTFLAKLITPFILVGTCGNVAFVSCSPKGWSIDIVKYEAEQRGKEYYESPENFNWFNNVPAL